MTLLHELHLIHNVPVSTTQSPLCWPQIMLEIWVLHVTKVSQKGKEGKEIHPETHLRVQGTADRIITANIHVKHSLCAKHHSTCSPCVHSCFSSQVQHAYDTTAMIRAGQVTDSLGISVSGCVHDSRPRKQTWGA